MPGMGNNIDSRSKVQFFQQLHDLFFKPHISITFYVFSGQESAIPTPARDLHLVSGNRVLHDVRRDAQDHFVLG